MKIGLVCPYNMFKGGGVQEGVLALQAELNNRHHEAIIVTPEPRTPKLAAPEGMRYLGRSARVKAQATSIDLSGNVDNDDIVGLLDRENFDIVHVHEPLVPFMARQLITRASCPVVGTFHAAIPENSVSRSLAGSVTPFVRSVVKHLDEITAVSQDATGFITEIVPANKIHIVPNGIDLTKYRPVPDMPRDPNTILYIGRLEKRKGVRYLLEAMQVLQVAMPDVELLIAGDGPKQERRRLEFRAQELGLKAVRFLGFVSDQRKRELLSTAGVFCSPAISGESFGIVLLEAMAMGTPIVAGDNPGYLNVLKQTGLVSLVNPKDTVDFARRLQLMLQDDNIRQTWQTWAAEYVKQYDYPKIVDQYEQIYKQLLAKK